MAGSVTGLHVFGSDTGPIPLSLLDTNYSAVTNALNTLINFSNSYIDGGAVNALSVTISAPQVFAYTDGVILQVKVSVTNTSTTPTINVNGLGAKTIVNPDGSALAVGALVSGAWAVLQYEVSSGKFQLQNPRAGSFSQLTVGPQSAGTALTINNLAGGVGEQILAGGATDILLALSGASAGQQGAMRFDSNAVVAAFLGSAGAANQLITGSAAGDFNIRTQGGAVRISTNSGASSAVVVGGNGACTIAAPSSGTGLTVNGFASNLQNVATFQGANSSGNSNGIAVSAGFTNTDIIALIRTFGGSNTIIARGDQSVQFPGVTTTASAANAFLDNANSNNLLRSTSSKRYKTDIEDLDSSIVERVRQLRPVRYRSTAQADDPTVWWYGLVAEEVAAVDPRLVHYTREVKRTRRLANGMMEPSYQHDLIPDGVQYDRVAVLLLAEVQRLRKDLDGLKASL